MTDELWFTRLLNQLLARPLDAVLGWLGLLSPHAPLMRALHLQPANPAAPIPDSLAMAVLVALLLVVIGTVLARRLSVDRPGALQHTVEVGWTALESHSEEVIGHGGGRFINYLFSLAVFILIGNLLGLVPSFGTPTAAIPVTLGLAITAFVYYHVFGLRKHGLFGYLKTFMGPVAWMAPIMAVVEVFSHLARIMSLSVRLYANMYAGELITTIFVALLPVAGVLFMGLHVFVALLQTYIFVVLAMVYLAGALAEEH